MRKFLSFLLVLILIFSMTACSGTSTGKDSKANSSTNTAAKDTTTSDNASKEQETKPEEDPFLTGEKPELNVLMTYTTFNMEEQPSYKVAEELTGYKINWFNLPQDNANEKLLLEIAGGTSYDLVMRIGYGLANQLYVQNALFDLKPYLDKYGENIYAAVPEIALSAVTGKNGIFYAIPQVTFDDPSPGVDPYGALKAGIAFNSSYLEELGMDTPTTLDEFYNVLKAYTDKTGKPALTQTATAWNVYLMPAFRMGPPSWYEVDGEYVHRIRHPGMVEYLAFMQKLYKEGLLDNDFPVNTAQTAMEKFTNGTSIAYPLYFSSIDNIYSAFQAAGINAKVNMATYLAPDADTTPVLYVNQGIVYTHVIPKTAKNPEHAIIWLNKLSEPEVFETIYIGKEGVSYEVKDGNYYPIFPEFSNYTNADKFSGVFPIGKTFKLWQARARKTEAMAEIYDQMNTRIDDYDVKFYYESYAAALEAVQNNEMSLSTMVNDSLIQAIVAGEDPQTAIDNIIAKWEEMGGIEYEEAMKAWYKENKDKFK